MKRLTIVLGMVGFFAIPLLGCAKPAELRPIPAHPFSRWVESLDAGQTQLEDVRSQFGEPDVIRQTVQGEKIWRYVFREIAWPDDDPMRPIVSSDGTLRKKTPSPLALLRAGIGVMTNWIGSAVYFPARQERPPRTRPLPATVHQLEVVFDESGVLRRFEYAPSDGSARVLMKR